ncbi:hypothetical protein F5Y15DRAFT_122342 [Xylariaceae sp. FL0016]|nr:hypothetical protein F5Y15DRAFT_122342 [Xylariaceae sp. FL0016]
MTPVTEIVRIPLKPGADAAPVDRVTDALVTTPGCLRVRTSRLHEDGDAVLMCVDWTSLAAHRAFMADEAVYGKLLRDLEPALRGAVSMLHVGFEPFPPTVLDGAGKEGGGGKSAVAEFVQLFFPGGDGFSGDEMAATALGVQHFLTEVEKEGPEGYTGETAAGWGVEEREFKGEKCRVFALVIGWDSVQAHMNFRETEGFKKAIPIFRGLEGLRGSEMCHVSSKTVAGRG